MSRQAVRDFFKANHLDSKTPLIKNKITKLITKDRKLLEFLPWLMSATQLEPDDSLYNYSLNSLRLEKAFGVWEETAGKRGEYRYTPARRPAAGQCFDQAW